MSPLEELESQVAALREEFADLLLAKSRLGGDLEGFAGRLAVIESKIRRLETSPPGMERVEPGLASAQIESRMPQPIKPLPRRFDARVVEENLRQPAVPTPLSAPERVEQVSAPINWEQFMGAKLFAWIGGLALFLGIALFVKYSFEHNLVSPAARVAIGYLCGLGLLLGGLVMRRRETAVTAQTLSSTGILVLYAVTFSCRAFYHFPFFDTMPTFLIMAAVTIVAILISVRMNALAVAVLGIAGGFLTPVLLSTDQDNPLLLFSYIALLDIGLLAVALRQQWAPLPVLGAMGTIAMQIGWVARYFVQNQYAGGNKILVVMTVFAGFFALFLAALAAANRRESLKKVFSGTSCWLGSSALAATSFCLFFSSLGERPLLLFGFAFLIDLGFLILSLLDERRSPAHARAGVSIFVLLAAWTQVDLSEAHLDAALFLYFIFALFHSAAPVVLKRWKGRTISGWSTIFPALALLLVLLPILKLAALSLAIWPFVFFLDLLAIFLALALLELLPILVAMLLTLVVLGAWIFQIPGDLTGFPASLVALGGFALFFILGAIWAGRKLGLETTRSEDLFLQIPALSATLPFLLLIMMTLRLPLVNPSMIFGVALLLALLLLGLARFMALEVLSVVALGCVTTLEYAWYFKDFASFHYFASHLTFLPLFWFLAFYGLFTVFPFIFHRHFQRSTLSWGMAALAGPAQFLLFYNLAREAYAGFNGALGLLPAAFTIPSLLGLWFIVKRTPLDSPARNAQLAWFGGVALLFMTLIFPVQFDRQWITLGWALEGAALCRLFHRIPHRGLPMAGTVLLVAAFSRLALNPEVLVYHSRSATPIVNWYLYAYGITALCLFAGARLLAPPRNQVADYNIPPLLWALGTLLCFLLLNIEIADYFSDPGTPVLTFEFEGNFARDLTYSIAWALFALLLLIIGIWKRIVPVRYASIGLIAVVLLKLFLHDLSTLDQLYRIAAFLVVAVIAILSSFLYQHFLIPPERSDRSQ